MKNIKKAMVLVTAGFLFFVAVHEGQAALADSFNYTYTDATGVSATGTLTGTLTAPGEYTLTSGTITLTGAPPCTNCGGLSGPLNGNGILASPPPQPFQVGGGTELIGLDNLLFPSTDPQLDTNGGLSFQMNSGLGIGIGGNGPGNYWIFGGNWSLNNNNGIFTATPIVPSSCSLVSDTSDMVNGNPAALVATPYNSAWTASIPDANWIWVTPTVDNPLIDESFTFTKTFVVSGTPASAMLNINADNSYDVLLNGVDVASNSGEFNYQLGNEGRFNVLGALRNGTNTLAATVKNFAQANGTPQTNPAGLLYQLAIAGASCNVLTATSTIPQQADLSIIKTADVASTTEGETVNYTIAVTNNGPAISTGVVATDTLPSGLTFISATTSEDSYASSTGTWTIGDMAVNSTEILNIRATVNSGTAGSTITNAATVGEDASTTDPDTTNNTASATVEVVSNAATSTVAPTLKFIFTNTTSSAIAGNETTFNIEAVDASGTIDTSFEQGVTLTVSGAGTGGGLVAIINGVGTSTVSDNTAETVTLGLEDSQSTGLNVSSTAEMTFAPGPVTQFILNHPGNMNENARLGYALGREDQFGNLVSASTTAAYLYSNSSSSNAAFFDAVTGGNEIASTTIPAGSTSTDFWYYDDSLGSRTVTASDNASAPDGTAGIADASDTFMVAPGAVKFMFENIPASTTVGSPVTLNVYAADSSDTIYPSFNGGVTVTTSGSATGGGLVTIVDGVGTTTITDATAETITLGLRDTESTGLGVGAIAQIIINPTQTIPSAPTIPSLPAAGGGPSSAAVALGIQPTIALTFSGMAYPGASVTVIRKDLGLQAAPTTQAIPVAADGSFLVPLNNVTRLTGQTYLLSFMDKNGLVAQTKAYNIPAQDKLIYGNILAAPTLGFESASVITKNAPLEIMGYATPKATVELFIDGNPAGTILVNDPSGKYTDAISTDGLALGRHAVWAIQTYGITAVEVSGYSNAVSTNELFADDATDGTLLSEDTSGTYAFVPAPNESENGFRLISIGASYIKQAESDFSNQESFTVSPLADPKLDLNGDGVIDVGDLSIFLSYLKNLNATVTDFHIVNPTIVKALDFNGDGVVDIKDLNILEAAIASSTTQ